MNLKNIWGSNPEENYFRHSFNTKERPQKTVLRIFADTGYELYLNERFVVTLDEWNNTRDYNVTPFLLAGNNTIAVQGINHGGHRGLAVELRMFFPDGREMSVASGKHWKTFPEERWGWTSPDFDDSAWENARELNLSHVGHLQWEDKPGDTPDNVIPYQTSSVFFRGNTPKCVDSPFYTKKKTKIPIPEEIIKMMGNAYAESMNACPAEIIAPEKIVSCSAGNGSATHIEKLLSDSVGGATIEAGSVHGGPSVIVDFGREVVGYLRLCVKSTSAVNFSIVYGEMLNDCYHLPPEPALLRTMVTETVRLCHGTQEWQSRSRQGFRFVKIEFMNCQSMIEISGIFVKMSLYPVSYLGYFSCSNPLLNRIWEAGRRTLHLCMQEYYLDGVRRDRFLWTGDCWLEALINYYVFGDRELFQYSWKSLADVQYSDGAIPSVLGKGASLIWDYVAQWIMAFGDYYYHTGDLEFPRSLKENIIRAVEWLVSKAGDDGLIDVPVNQTEGWMAVLNNRSGKDLMMNYLYYQSLRTVRDIMNGLGDKKMAERYDIHMEKTAAAFSALDGSLGLEKYIPTFYHGACRSLEGFEAMRAYFRNNRPEEGLNLIRDNWACMLEAGSDTLWETPMEQYDMRVDEVATSFISRSRCHGWSGGPTYALLSEAAGITPTAPGFKEFEIRPQLGTLSFVKGVVPTPNGFIAVSIQNDGTRYTGTVYVPAGCTAHVLLPQCEGKYKVMTANNEECPQIQKVKNISGYYYVCFAIKISGVFKITCM